MENSSIPKQSSQSSPLSRFLRSNLKPVSPLLSRRIAASFLFTLVAEHTNQF
ncbi:hypothetical protein V2J09_005894 [Rumex salicifolius]